MTEWAHPAGPLLVGAALVGLLPRRLRPALLLGAPAAALVLAWALPDAGDLERGWLGWTLVVRADPLGRLFALVFALLGGLGALYGLPAPGAGLPAAALAATGAAVAVALAGDWVSLYAAWEGLALASFALVLDGRTPAARAAAYRYLLVHAAGGACLLAGVAGQWARGDSLAVGPLAPAGPGLLILLGVAVNAAVPPLHAWLPDAYPESSPPGSVFLSAFATKAAVCVLARAFAGVEALVWAGVVMALYGVLFALLENDIRRLLAYHIVSQVGYMVAGVGLGTPLGVNGAAAHAFSHILYKGLLFMGAGAVVHATGRGRLTELGGLGRRMPGTAAGYLVGALSISGAPLLNGFVSKSLVVAAAEAEHRWVVAALLTLASVGTFLSVGLKLPVLAFGGPDRGLRPAPVPRPMHAAMTLTSALCLLIGVVPTLLYRWLPHPVTYRPYTADHVLGALELLVGTAAAFHLLGGRLRATATVTVDFDRLYRAIGRGLAEGVALWTGRLVDALEGLVASAADRPVATAAGVGTPVGYAVLTALASLGLALALFGR